MPTRMELLRREFLKALARRLQPLGFKRSDRNYYRKTEYGMHGIGINFSNVPGKRFHVIPDIWVRHDAIEELINKRLQLPKEIARFSSTIGNRLDNMLRGLRTIQEILEDRHSWGVAVTCDDDIDPAVDWVLSMLDEIANPYFERFSSLEEILSIFLDSSREAQRYHLQGLMRRSMTILIASSLLDKGDLFNEQAVLLESCLADRSERGDSTITQRLPDFRELVEELESGWDTKALAGSSHKVT